MKTGAYLFRAKTVIFLETLQLSTPTSLTNTPHHHHSLLTVQSAFKCNFSGHRVAIAPSTPLRPLQLKSDNSRRESNRQSIIKWQSFRQPNHYHKKTCIEGKKKKYINSRRPYLFNFNFGERSVCD